MTNEDLSRRLMAAIAARVPADEFVNDLADPSIAADGNLLAKMLEHGRARRIVRMWQGQKSLVTSKRLAMLPEFRTAAALSSARGWPVVVRESAGLTVAHRPGVLNVSCLTVSGPSPAGISISGTYDDLLDLLLAVLGDMGVRADRGSVPGAYCDGSQNLRLGGRKLAGASARLVRRDSRAGLISHASITVYGNVREDVEAVEAFERALGLDVAYSAEAHCSLADFIVGTTASSASACDSSGERGPSLRSSLGEIPNFSL